MDKKYEKYFGKNVARILYVISVGLLFYEVFNLTIGRGLFVGLAGGIGLILFFSTSHRQASDKDIDEIVQKAEDAYLEKKVIGKTVAKQELDGKDFSVFSGFIRDSGDIRFKAGRDEKIRTSRFYVTAISCKKNDCKVFTTVYDIITGQEVSDSMICTAEYDAVSVSKEKIEFPRGSYKCRFSLVRNEEMQDFEFYIADDALADQLLERVEKK